MVICSISYLHIYIHMGTVYIYICIHTFFWNIIYIFSTLQNVADWHFHWNLLNMQWFLLCFHTKCRISLRKCLAVKIPSPISTSSLKMSGAKDDCMTPFCGWCEFTKSNEEFVLRTLTLPTCFIGLIISVHKFLVNIGRLKRQQPLSRKVIWVFVWTLEKKHWQCFKLSPGICINLQ